MYSRAVPVSQKCGEFNQLCMFNIVKKYVFQILLHFRFRSTFLVSGVLRSGIEEFTRK